MGQATGEQGVVERLGVRYISGPAEHDKLFTFVTLLARAPNYERLLISAEKVGFTAENSQFLALDNRFGNRFDGYDAIRRALTEACGRYIVFTHDDVEFTADGAAELEARLAELTAFDPGWVLAGNAGGARVAARKAGVRGHIDDPHELRLRVPGPELVETLDENFFVMRREQPVVNSCDLTGFHFYASDLCRLAEIMGGRSYVIPFLLRHHSGGGIDATYSGCRDRFGRKYRRYFIGRDLLTTVDSFRFGLSGLREGWGETPQSRWNYLKRHVYAPASAGAK